MFSSATNSVSEQQAFFSLLDEYFTSRSTVSHPSSAPARSPPSQHQEWSHPHPIRTTPHTPAGLTSSASASSSPPPSSSSSSFSNSLTTAALKQPALTAPLLRQAGLTPAAASLASRTAARNAEALAPAVNAGIRQGVRKTPTGPQGLSSSRSIAGGFSTESGGAFGKSLFKSKGPMSSQEAEKNKFREALAVKRTPSSSSTPSPQPVLSDPMAELPVPHRRGVERNDLALGTEELARLEYDYQGTDPDDLPAIEGDQVIVLQRVSDDWWRCRSQVDGREGLIPASYMKLL
ncbi:hypothetical protein T439DRAFT_330078 [Meredithblackwellia eburnea MCA 4105]